MLPRVVSNPRTQAIPSLLPPSAWTAAVWKAEAKLAIPMELKKNTTEARKEQTDSVNTLMEELKKKLLDLQPGMVGTSASPATAPGTIAAKATTVGHMSWLTPVMLLTYTVLPGILGLY